MSNVTLNGNTYTDDADPSTGLANGGHRARFVPALSDFLAEAALKIAAAATHVATALGYANAASASASSASSSAGNAATSASNAAASAATAAAAPGTAATSSTSLTIGTGTKSLTIQTGKSLAPGMPVILASAADPTVWMFGPVISYNSGSGALAVNVTTTSGSGTIASWTVSLCGPMAPQNMPITSLGKGTAAANQLIRVNAAGNGIEGTLVGAARQQLRVNAAGDALEGFQPIAFSATAKTGNYAAAAGDTYAQDTSGGAFSVTLPASPSIGDPPILIHDIAGTFAAQALTLGANGNKIYGLAEDMTVTINNFSGYLAWSGATYGWRFLG